MHTDIHECCQFSSCLAYVYEILITKIGPIFSSGLCIHIQIHVHFWLPCRTIINSFCLTICLKTQITKRILFCISTTKLWKLWKCCEAAFSCNALIESISLIWYTTFSTLKWTKWTNQPTFTKLWAVAAAAAASVIQALIQIKWVSLFLVVLILLIASLCFCFCFASKWFYSKSLQIIRP